MAKTGCTVELLEVPKNMAETKMAPMTFSTSPCAVLRSSSPYLSIPAHQPPNEGGPPPKQRSTVNAEQQVTACLYCEQACLCKAGMARQNQPSLVHVNSKKQRAHPLCQVPVDNESQVADNVIETEAGDYLLAPRPQ